MEVSKMIRKKGKCTWHKGWKAWVKGKRGGGLKKCSKSDLKGLKGATSGTSGTSKCFKNEQNKRWMRRTKKGFAICRGRGK
jgi:hypothetical protein